MLLFAVPIFSARYGLFVIDNLPFNNDAFVVNFLMRSNSIAGDNVHTITYQDVMKPTPAAKKRMKAWYQLLNENAGNKNLTIFVGDGDSAFAKNAAFQSKFGVILNKFAQMTFPPNILLIVECRQPAAWSRMALRNSLIVVVNKKSVTGTYDQFVKDFTSVARNSCHHSVKEVLEDLKRRAFAYDVDIYGDVRIGTFQLADFLGCESREHKKGMSHVQLLPKVKRVK